ncbi:MAG: hypothetical protein H0W96_09705 [Solirubrobacterales bacterium]|nr:hypothetical protein [Solirubrobacterales bacterium]
MRKPSAIVDVASIAFESFGVRVEVSMTPAEQIELVRPLLPPGHQSCDSADVQKRFAIVAGARAEYTLLRDGEQFAERLGLELALVLLEAQVRAYVALHAPDRIFVHAGVVAHAGKAIVIPGMSFSGKTMLVAALVRAGATYLSDEFAPLDEHGLVHPYPKPLSIRDERRVQHEHDVASIGGTAGDQPLRVGLVVATEYRPGAQWRPRRLSAGQGLLALLAHTVAAQTRPEQVMRFLTRAVGETAILESPRDEAAELAGALLCELER